MLAHEEHADETEAQANLLRAVLTGERSRPAAGGRAPGASAAAGGESGEAPAAVTGAGEQG
jgi:hypothetical protein